MSDTTPYDGDCDTGNVRVRVSNGAWGTIEQEHLQIHLGNGYTLSGRAAIADAAGTHEYLIVVPAGVYPHFRTLNIKSDGGPFDIDFYESTTYSSVGVDPITPNNNNRNSANTALLEFYDTPTLSTDGVPLEQILAPGTTGAIGTDATNEWVLKPSTDYMIRITNNKGGVGTSNFAVNAFFYE